MKLGTATAVVAVVGALAATAAAMGVSPPATALQNSPQATTSLPGKLPGAAPAWNPGVEPGFSTSARTATPVRAIAEAAPEPSPAAPSTTWSADLSAGETAGVSLVAGAARLSATDTFLAPVEDATPTDGSGVGSADADPAAPADTDPTAAAEGSPTSDGPETTPAGEAGAASAGTDGTALSEDPAPSEGTAPSEDTAPGEGAATTEGAAAGAEAVPTGLLTLPAKKLTTATDRVDTTVVGDVPAGSTATVDVRARTSSGGWSEWIPAGVGSIVSLPEPSSEVQARLVLTGPPKADPTAAAGSGATGPAVRGVSLTTHPATAAARADAAASSKSPVHSRVFATREGLVGATTANGHKIKKKDRFVALPSRRALSPRGTNDYTVKVCASNGRCAFAPVWDVGPWNTRDDYWNPSSKRQEWKDLPQGMPEAQAAKQKGYNGGRDQFKRKVANPAGIDLGDGIFWDALKLKDNSWVTVDYLWTGSTKMAKVTSEGKVRSTPDSDAEVVGIATLKSSVPVECVQGKGKNRWLRIGMGQYLSAKAVDDLGSVGPCSASGKTTSADHSDDANKKGAATEGAVADGGPVAGQGATPATGKPSDLAPRAVVDGAPDGTPPAGGTAATGATATGATATGPAEPGSTAVRPGGTGSGADRTSAAAASG